MFGFCRFALQRGLQFVRAVVPGQWLQIDEQLQFRQRGPANYAKGKKRTNPQGWKTGLRLQWFGHRREFGNNLPKFSLNIN